MFPHRRLLLALLCLPALTTCTHAQVLLNGSHKFVTSDENEMFIDPRRAVDRSDCGQIAFVSYEALQYTFHRLLLYETFEGGGAGEVTELPRGFNTEADAAYDSDCRLFVYLASGSQTETRIRQDDGAFLTFERNLAIPDFTGAAYNLLDFFRGEDGNLHAVHFAYRFVRDGRASEKRLIWGTWRNGAWEDRVISDYSGTIFGPLDAAVNAYGHLYVLADPPSSHSYSEDLFFNVYSPELSTSENVRPAPGMDFHPLEASLALGPNGEISIAGTFMQTVETGSPTYINLRYLRRTGDNQWNETSIATSDDDYHGSDGSNYTGRRPLLEYDESGGLHLAFSDHSNWHNPYSESEIGQVRYGYLPPGGTAWTLTTVFRQPGRSASPDPLHGFRLGGLAPSPSGRRANIFGAERIVVYNNDPFAAPDIVTMNGLQFDVQNTQAASVAAPNYAVLNWLLGRPFAGGAPADGNGDGALGSADLIGTIALEP
ncbi:hypothetical protein KQI84_12200 [bacterium]|nr:hypothetical protein [bacterium]